MVKPREALSFGAMEKRIQAMPDGPSSVLDTPKKIQWLSFVGIVGIVIGLLPSLLVLVLPARQWMVTMAQIGVFTALLGTAPYILRSLWVILRGVRNWKTQQVEQLDHDMVHFRALDVWLRSFSIGELEEHRQLSRLIAQQMEAKLGLLAGGMSRVGYLPVAASLFLLLLNVRDPLDIPGWLAVIGILVVLLYVISSSAVLMKIRLDFYSALLNHALERKQ